MNLEIKNARKGLSLTQEEIAKASGISRSYYTRIENGTAIPTVNVAKSIASILKIQWVFFFES